MPIVRIVLLLKMTLQGECFVVLKNVINLWERDFLELGTEREGWVEREG